MEKITLQPGEWQQFGARRLFQVIGQNNVRIGFGSGTGPVNGSTYSAPPAGAPYITTQGYDPKVIDVLAMLRLDTANACVYLMPDADKAVDIVAF